MITGIRCLYNNSFTGFLSENQASIFGKLCNNYNGIALPSTRDSWVEEISVMKHVISNFESDNGQIILEYDIPRLGKRIDVVLLLRE